ncbi:hypothetical protein SNL152K_1224 [Streptomyces sp. NL15-2K]|nr:hypothetical protein SNL152K_1224 [Streptomyces sp. NL15-2K]
MTVVSTPSNTVLRVWTAMAICVLAVPSTFPLAEAARVRGDGRVGGVHDAASSEPGENGEAHGRPVRTNSDFSITVEHGPEALRTAATVVIPPFVALAVTREVPQPPTG